MLWMPASPSQVHRLLFEEVLVDEIFEVVTDA